MEKTFRKITIGFFSLFLVSIMLVSAGVYPIPFTSNNQANVAVVYGVNAAVTDSTAADSLVTSLANGIITEEELERIFSAGVTEDEVDLGSNLRGSGNIKATLTDNKLDYLFDGKIYWDDGDDTNSYNVHEEIIIGSGIGLKTTLDDNDFEEVALVNDKGLEYRLVFEEDIFTSTRELGGDAEALEITILGKEYEIEDVDGNSITLVTSEEISLNLGDSVIVEGKTLTLDDLSSTSAKINGVIISEGSTKKVNGLEVKVEEDSIFYNDNFPEQASLTLRIGSDLIETFDDGDAYIGEDEDDPEWVWSIDNPGEKDGWIGVRYNLRQSDYKDDVVYEGEEYTFPNDFATVRFDSLTDVDYYDYEVYFDEVDLYERRTGNSGNGVNSVNSQVVVIKGENDDSFDLGDNIETDTLYLIKTPTGAAIYYMDLAEDFSTGKPVFYKTISAESLMGTLELTTKNLITWEPIVNGITETISYTIIGENFVIEDIPEGYTLIYYPNTIGDNFVTNVANVVVLNEGVNNIESLPLEIDVGDNYCNNGHNPEATVCTGAKLWLILGDETTALTKLNSWDMADTLFETDLIIYTKEITHLNQEIATLIADDTEIEVGLAGGDITLSIGDIKISLGGGNNFLHLGNEAEDAEGNDVKIGTQSIGTYDNDVMDYYGTIIESPENNADDDKVVIKVPSERVYAQISVLGSEEDSSIVVVNPTPIELGITKITDVNVASTSGKNIIVVGGSCINTEAARLLGGKFCGADFTANTGVNPGQVLIQTFDRGNGNVATLVAGYNAEDTVRGVAYLLSNNINIAVGEKIII